MPYKAVGRSVFVKKGDRWVLLKRHKTPERAKKHATALNVNVRE